ncbi:MAG: MAPEG family protein [Pseudomonadota bacterium]
MTPELFWLTLTMALAASLWIPFIIHVNATDSGAQVDNGLANVQGMARWGRMAYRAHLNLLEQAMPFAGLVILAHLIGVSSALTVAAAVAFFWLRVAHMGVMLFVDKQIPIRPIIFTAGWVCCLLFVVEILRLG